MKTLEELMELAAGSSVADRMILRSALRELIADAERYRWLRDHGWNNETGANIRHISPECWAEAIDAARRP